MLDAILERKDAIAMALSLRALAERRVKESGLAIDAGANSVRSACFFNHVMDLNTGAYLPRTHRDFYHALREWTSCGMPTFSLSRGLACMLSLTDCFVSPAEVPLPFPNFRIEIPEGVFPLRDGTSIKVMHFRDHFLVPQDAEFSEKTKEAIRNPFFGEYPSDKPEAIDAFINMMETLPTKRMITMLRSSVDQVHRQSIVADTDEWRQHLDRVDCSWDGDDDAILGTWRLIFNLCSYMACHKNEIREVKERVSKPDMRWRRKTTPVFARVWELGKDIKISPELERAAIEANSGNAGYKLTKKFVVRGHYRDQPVGKGRKDIRKTWVRPYWKGPADGIAIVRGYKAEDS